jgi:hypothetical protein
MLEPSAENVAPTNPGVPQPASRKKTARPSPQDTHLSWREGTSERWEKLMDGYQRWVFVGLN